MAPPQAARRVFPSAVPARAVPAVRPAAWPPAARSGCLAWPFASSWPIRLVRRECDEDGVRHDLDLAAVGFGEDRFDDLLNGSRIGSLQEQRGIKRAMGDAANHSGGTALGGEADTGPVVVPAGHAAPVRVVLVDDHALVREGTLELLDQEPDIEVVGQAGTGEEGVVLLERTRPDVALIDINLPGMSGLELARMAAARYLEVRVLIVSAYDDYAYVSEALEIGVAGYLLKTASAKELVDAVRAVAGGVFVLDRAVSGRLTRRWQRRPDGPPGADALTSREVDVFGLLARGQSNKQIAVELGLGLRTVEGHVSSVLCKLGVASRTEAALYALGHRLVAGEDHDGPPRSR
ncbi:MAG: response regulator [Acidimicrobiales bacterium]